MTVTYDAFSLKRLQIFVYFFKNNGLDKQPGSSFFCKINSFCYMIRIFDGCSNFKQFAGTQGRNKY